VNAMPPAIPAKGKGKRVGDSSVNKYSKPSKKVKPELTKDEKLRKKWRSLKDQVLEGFLENAYKTSKRSECIAAWYLLT
jgi:hypothetical protein